MRESFTFYRSFADGLKELDDATYRRLTDAIINYALNDEEPILNGLEMTVFQAWKANVNASNRRKDNGKKGGRPTEKTNGYDMETEMPEGYESENRNEQRLEDAKPNKKEKENKKETVTKKDNSGRFTPPTPDEVCEYIREKGYNVDADKFVDFYESKGWMIGKNKMKDWKAAVRTWARGQRQEVTAKGTNKFNNFTPSGTNWDDVAEQIMEAELWGSG